MNPSFVIQEDPDWDANSPNTINPHIPAVLVMNHLNLVQKGSTRIGEDTFDSDLTWRRLIRTVLEQSLAMLRSHSSVVL